MAKKKSTSKKTKKKVIAEKKSDNIFEIHPFTLASLIILCIMFLTAAVLSYLSFTATVEVVFYESEADPDDVLIPIKNIVDYQENQKEKEEVIQTDPCKEVKLTVICSSETVSGLCDYMIDKNNKTQWVSGVACTSGRTPCPVSEQVTISSTDNFQKVLIENRIEPSFYINRILLNYNEIKGESHVLGAKFIKEPFEVILKQETQTLLIDIVEIIGVGRNFQTGISQIKAYTKECLEE